MIASRRLACLALSAALLSLPLLAQAQWKWRDANGRVTVSDRPPPAGIPARDILQQPGGSTPPGATPRPATAAAPADAASGPARPVDPELEARKKKADEAAAAKKKAEAEAEAAAAKAEEQRLAAARRDNCDRARGALRALEDGQRVARTNAAGEREFLSDAQRSAEAARMRAVVASDCR